jgi:hypothetical protein
MSNPAQNRPNVMLVSNVHLRQRGVEAADDAAFRRHIFGREVLGQLIPALRPGPANTDPWLLDELLGPVQREFFRCLPCPLCGRRDHWYVRTPHGHRVISATECMCRRSQ